MACRWQSGASASMRRSAISPLLHLARLPITIDPETDAHIWTTTLQLADRFRLTMYDAAYLELAQRHALPLATLDAGLRLAAEALGLALPGIAP